MTRLSSETALSYADAVDWIYERINYERVPPVRSSPHFQLERVRRQLALIGSPQQRLPCIHIAGTKGKGSTAAMLDAIIRAAGLTSGLFTSPHLIRFEERMQVGGQCPDPEELTELVAELRERLEAADEVIRRSPPTYFEVATLLAWMYFDRRGVDLVVLETGLGGRLDCTNVCSPVVTVITNIGLDHTAVLGDTIEKIAEEKLGILKPGVPLITGVTQPEVIALSDHRAGGLQVPVQRVGSDIHLDIQKESRGGQTISVTTPWRLHENLHLPLVGAHQAENAALAVAAADTACREFPSLTPMAIRGGLAATVWPLRFEAVEGSPTIIFDAAHNPDAASALIATLNNGCWPERPRVLVFAASTDKDVAGMLQTLQPHFDFLVLTRYAHSPRSCSPVELQELVPDSSGVLSADAPDHAMIQARSLSGPHGLVVVTGSVFLAAQCRTL